MNGVSHRGKASTGAVTNFFFRVWKALSHFANHQNPSVDFAVRQKGSNLCKILNKPTARPRKLPTSDTLAGMGHCSTALILSRSVLIPSAETTWPRYETWGRNRKHFEVFSFSSAWRKHSKTSHSHSCCSLKSRPNTITSSR